MKVTVKHPPPPPPVFCVADIVINAAMGVVFLVTEHIHSDEYAATILQTHDHLLRVGENTTFISSERFKKLPVGESITIDGNRVHLIEWRNTENSNTGYYLVDKSRDTEGDPYPMHDLTVLIEYTRSGKSPSQGLYFSTSNKDFHKFTGSITLENE